METDSLFIVTTVLSTVFMLLIVISVIQSKQTYFNANRFKASSEIEIVPINFYVVKIEDSETQYDESRVSKNYGNIL